MKHIDVLAIVILDRHGSPSTHLQSVPVTELVGGHTVWDGVVEVYRLHGHPKANLVYAWSNKTDKANSPEEHITALHVPPTLSPLLAVRFIVKKSCNARSNV